jgi:hypothetical protein
MAKKPRYPTAPERDGRQSLTMPKHGQRAAKPKSGLSQIAAPASELCCRGSTAAIAVFVESILTPAAIQPPKLFRIGRRKSSTASRPTPKFHLAAPASSASLCMRAPTLQTSKGCSAARPENSSKMAAANTARQSRFIAPVTTSP